MPIKTNIQDVNKRLRARVKRFERIAPKAVKSAGDLFIRKIVTEQMTGRKGNRGLNVVTGTIRRSWHSSIKQAKNMLTLFVATASKYARVHEYGGTVRIPEARVKQFTRRNRKGFTKSEKKRSLKQTAMKGGFSVVRAHVRKAHNAVFKPRLLVRKAWKHRMTPIIMAALRAAWRKSK